jgi:hypothetical protein
MRKVLLLVIILILVTPAIGLIYVKAPNIVDKQGIGQTDRYINSARAYLDATIDIMQSKSEDPGGTAKKYLQKAYNELATIGVPTDKMVDITSAIDSYITNPSSSSLELVRSKADDIIQEAISIETDIQIKSFRLILISLLVLFTICMSLICFTTDLIY